MKPFMLMLIGLCFFFACQDKVVEPLPILGEKQEIEGKMVYHTIPDFEFINQDSQKVTNATFENKIYVVDFFFVSCPTICPKVTKQMLRLYEKFENEDRLVLMSHTIDPKRDTVGRLKNYATNLEVETDKWHFVTGDKDELYEIADDYFSIVLEDSEAPGGFDHSGRLILIDENRRIRAFCTGTDAEEVTRFMKDVENLLANG